MCKSGHPKPKRMTVDQWSEKLFKYGKDPDDKRYGDYMGLSPGGAAGHLNVGRPMVNNLIRRGILDVIELLDREGAIVAWILTDNSIDRYVAQTSRKACLPNGK